MSFSSIMKPFWTAADWISARRWLLRIVVTGFLIGLGCSTVYRGGIGKKARTDLTVFLRAAEAIPAGEHLYDVKTSRQWNYVYLPLLATLLVPFTPLPLAVNSLLLYLINAFCLCGSFWIGFHLARDRLQGFRVSALAWLLCLPVFLNCVTRGQMGVISLFLILLVFLLYTRNRPLAAGFLLAFTVVLKTSPVAALVFFFLAKREWKVLAGAAAGAVCFLFLYPSLILGWERNWMTLKEYYAVMSHAVSATGHTGRLWAQLVTPFAEDNQSLYAVITRAVWKSEEAFIAGSTAWLRIGSRAAGILSLGVLMWIARRPRGSVSRERLLLEYALFAMPMIFFLPIAQTHHYTVMFLVLCAVFFFSESGEAGKHPWFLQSAALAAAVLYLLGLAFSGPGYAGLPAWGGFFLWAVAAGTLWVSVPAKKPGKDIPVS